MLKKLILASGSPRRKEILEKLGIPFDVIPSNYEENMTENIAPEELAKKLALGKATDVAGKVSNSIVIGADTFIYFEGKKLGKPKTSEKAAEMLTEMSGKPHLIYTGYAIIDSDTKQTVLGCCETKVYFRQLNSSEIKNYVNSGEPLDRAGAYAIQGIGSVIVEKIVGDYFNVVGLPISQVAQSLKEFGYELFGK